MYIEDNTMNHVDTGKDIRITWEDEPLHFHHPLNNNPTYQDMVAAGLLNRKITVVNNTITKASPTLAARMLIDDPLESLGVGIYIKGKVLKKSQLEASLKNVVGSYIVSGIVVKGNTVKTAIGKGIQLKRTNSVSLSSNAISGTKPSQDTGLLPARSSAYALWTASSAAPVLKGKNISAGWGVYLSKSSSEQLSATTQYRSYPRNPPSISTKTSKARQIRLNKLTVTGSNVIKTALNQKTPIIEKKESSNKVSGAGTPKTAIYAYAANKK